MSTAISPTAYNYKVVRQFAIMTVVWGILGMGLGVFIASQLVWPQLNLDHVVFAGPAGGAGLWALARINPSCAQSATSQEYLRKTWAD